jgi:hypothetical protein
MLVIPHPQPVSIEDDLLVNGGITRATMLGATVIGVGFDIDVIFEPCCCIGHDC